MEKKKKFRLFDAILATVCITLVAESVMPTAAIGNSQYFWWIFLIIAFCIPYVILSVMPKLNQMDTHLTEAALDLGCTPVKAFFKVVLPSISSGIVTGFIMAFTLSLDDFVISYFTTGPDFQTLPLLIYSMTKKRVTPDMYALSTIMFVSILLLLILFNLSQSKAENKKEEGGRR